MYMYVCVCIYIYIYIYISNDVKQGPRRTPPASPTKDKRARTCERPQHLCKLSLPLIRAPLGLMMGVVDMCGHV